MMQDADTAAMLAEAGLAPASSVAVPANPLDRAPYPLGLALEMVLSPATPLTDLLEAYNLTPEQMRAVLRNPSFRQEYETYQEEMRKEGWSFRQKAKAQSEEYLKTTWRMIHDPVTPSTVKADLIKQTVRWAGLEAPIAPQAQQTFGFDASSIEALRSMPDAELEVRVMQLVARRNPQSPSSGSAQPAPPPASGSTLNPADILEAEVVRLIDNRAEAPAPEQGTR